MIFAFEPGFKWRQITDHSLSIDKLEKLFTVYGFAIPITPHPERAPALPVGCD